MEGSTNNDAAIEKWVSDKVGSVEIGQYSCFGLILLDYLLTKKTSELMVHEPLSEQQSKLLRKEIQQLEKLSSASIAYREQFRSGIKTILETDQPFLADSLEKHWRFEQLDKNIYNKLDSIEKQRLAREQTVSANKQDRLNNMAFIFTIVSLASVMAAIVTLSPLKKIFHEDSSSLDMTSQLFFVILMTVIIIALAGYLAMKTKGTNRKTLNKISSAQLEYRYQKKIHKKYGNKVPKIIKDILNKVQAFLIYLRIDPRYHVYSSTHD